MPTGIVFKCEFCGCRPDPETQRALERQLLDLRHGEYVDAEPGRWLTWHGRGFYGPNRYACGEHRGELKAELRERQFTDAQWAELRLIFPRGVCDYSKPGVEQRPTIPWLTYQTVSGRVIYGGRPLGPAPRSVAF